MRWLILLLFAHLAAHETVMDLVENYPFEGYERVLQIGFDDGSMTAALAQEVPDGLVIGTNPSQEKVELAELTYDLELFSNFTFIQANVNALPFSQDFDLVVSIEGVEWEAGRAIDNIYNALVTGGRMIVMFSPATLSEEEAQLLASQFLASRVRTTEEGDLHLEAIK